MKAIKSSRQKAYLEYLTSDHWKAFKKRKAKIEPKVCLACASRKRIQLHHMLYRATMEESRPEDTIWLCQPCHGKFHKRSAHLKKGPPVEWLITETLRIINEPEKPAKPINAKRLRFENKLAERRALKSKRRAEHDAREARFEAERAAGLRKPKKIKQRKGSNYAILDAAVRQAKHSPAIHSQPLSGVVVVNRPSRVTVERRMR